MKSLRYNHDYAILTIPGELSCAYEEPLVEYAESLGYSDLALFGLTNDAHGYLISPQEWERKTKESQLSFGGKSYGDVIPK